LENGLILQVFLCTVNRWQKIKGKVVTLLIKCYPMETYERMDILLHHSQPWSLMEVNGQHHSLATLLLGKEPLVGGQIGLRARLALWRREISLSGVGNRTKASSLHP
jgi:hypothetical protein